MGSIGSLLSSVLQFIDPNNPPFYLIGLPPAAISLVFKAFYGFASKLDSLGIILVSLERVWRTHSRVVGGAIIALMPHGTQYPDAYIPSFTGTLFILRCSYD